DDPPHQAWVSDKASTRRAARCLRRFAGGSHAARRRVDEEGERCSAGALKEMLRHRPGESGCPQAQAIEPSRVVLESTSNESPHPVLKRVPGGKCRPLVADCSELWNFGGVSPFERSDRRIQEASAVHVWL